jgi:hypothetical protein
MEFKGIANKIISNMKKKKKRRKVETMQDF